MSNLIPKNDYFKHSTRAILTEAEKQETFDAVNRSIRFLFERGNKARNRFKTFEDGWKYLMRCLQVTQGSIQPRHFYSRVRRIAVLNEAWCIAQKTGAPYTEVREAFLGLMEQYIEPE